jgi:uncharacterized protein YggE
VPLLRCLAVTFVLTLPTLAFAQAPDPCATAPQTCATLINTHANAETRLPSTVVDISVEITANGKDLATVQRQLAEKSASLLTYLRGEKVQRLVTNVVNFTPETKSSHSSVDKTVGYDGASSIGFRTLAENAPTVLSGVLDHGANTINSTHFTPTEEEIAAARRELAAQATQTAISQAEAIAKAAGMKVVSVRTINVQADEGSVSAMNGYANALMKSDRFTGGLTPVDTAAGEQVFSTRVDITVAASH